MLNIIWLAKVCLSNLSYFRCPCWTIQLTHQPNISVTATLEKLIIDKDDTSEPWSNKMNRVFLFPSSAIFEFPGWCLILQPIWVQQYAPEFGSSHLKETTTWWIAAGLFGFPRRKTPVEFEVVTYSWFLLEVGIPLKGHIQPLHRECDMIGFIHNEGGWGS